MNPAARMACPEAQGERSAVHLQWLSPRSDWTQDQVAQYLRARANDHFFPVPDPEETRVERIDAVLENRFEFNGEPHILEAPIDWLCNPSVDVEWHISLHKFYYAVGLGMRYRTTGDPRYVDKWVSLLSSWMDQVPVGFIAADVTGRRVQNWIYAFHYFAPAIGSGPLSAAFLCRWLDSIREQVEFLCANLTPARNHRTLELYAIFLAGVAFPEFRDADRWRRFALGEIVKNVQTDLLPDGVQCELSTDYHHLVLKNYLCIRRLARLNAIDVPEVLDQRLIQALEFSLFVHKPDGVVPSLSDGDARSFLDLLQQGADLYGRADMRYVATRGRSGSPPGSCAQGFPVAGYYTLRSGWGQGRRAYEDEHYLVFDCGPLGAGNHGHLDCLSFELAAFGRSLVVDPGRYTYSEAGETNWRVRFRGSAYHNTVTVDGRNQTRYEPREIREASRHARGSLRHRISGPAPEATLRNFVSRPGFAMLHGTARSHEYDAVHDRRIMFVFEDYWVVSDFLSGDSAHRYDLWLHLTERAQDSVQCDRRRGTLVIDAPGLRIAHEDLGGIDVAVEPGKVSYRYGEALDAPILRLTQTGMRARFNTVLHPWRDQVPELIVRELRVTGAPGGPDPADSGAACALRVQTGGGAGAYTDYLFVAEPSEHPWQFAGLTFSGTFLALRRDAAGEIVELHADAGASLRDTRGPVLWRGLGR